MMRPTTWTNDWLCVVSSVALVISVLSSPVRAPLGPVARYSAGLVARNLAFASKGSAAAITAATPVVASPGADDSDVGEEEKDETSWFFSVAASPTFLSSVSPPGPLSGLQVSHSAVRAAAVPLRC